MNNFDYSGEKEVNNKENKKEKDLEKNIYIDNNINKSFKINYNSENDVNDDSKEDNLKDKLIENNSSSPLNIHYFMDLIEDSKCTRKSNSFCVFKSINNIFYLIYSNENNSIISYDLINFKKINEIKKAHNSEITDFRYCFDNINKRDIILSISAIDNNLKLWDIYNFELLLDIKDINKNGVLSSACLLNNNNEIYIITSNCNFENFKNSEPIKVFNLNGSLVNILDNEDELIYYIDIYYDKTLSMSFIISGGTEYVKSYDFNGSILYNKYSENKENLYYYVIINDKEEQTKIISSSVDYIIIWDFHSGELLNKITGSKSLIFNICLWNNDYLFASNEESFIELIDIKNKKFIKNLNWQCDGIIHTIKKIIHPKYGECLIVQSRNNKIIMWIIK